MAPFGVTIGSGLGYAGNTFAFALVAWKFHCLERTVLELSGALTQQSEEFEPLADEIRQAHARWTGKGCGCCDGSTPASHSSSLSSQSQDPWAYDDLYRTGDYGLRDHYSRSTSSSRGMSSMMGGLGSVRDYDDYSRDRYSSYDDYADLDYAYGGYYGGYSRGASQTMLKRTLRNRTRVLVRALDADGGADAGACAAGHELSTTLATARQRIPLIVHQTWKTDQLPAKYAGPVLSWRRLHPKWSFQFWDDRAGRDLMHRHFPQYAAAYDRMSGIKRADVVRVAILYVHGGVYADIDVEAVQPFDQLVDAACVVNAGILLGEENFVHAVLLEQTRSTWLVSNAVMVSVPGHPFWLEVLEEIFKNTWCGDDPVQCTGPRLVDRLTWQHVRRNPACSGAHGCIIRLPYAYFSPHLARWNAHNMEKECRDDDSYPGYLGYSLTSRAASRRRPRNELTMKACKYLERAIERETALQTRRTFAVHHWQCSWCRQDATMHSTISLAEIMRQHDDESAQQSSADIR